MINLEVSKAHVVNEVVVSSMLTYWRNTGFNPECRPHFKKFQEFLFANPMAMTSYEYPKVVQLYGVLSNEVAKYGTQVRVMTTVVDKEATYVKELFMACKFAVSSVTIIDDKLYYVEDFLMPILENFLEQEIATQCDKHLMAKLLNLMITYIEENSSEY